MHEKLKQKIIQVCNSKIETKGTTVGLSFYAFFANKNDDPELLMEVANWIILKKQLKLKRWSRTWVKSQFNNLILQRQFYEIYDINEILTNLGNGKMDEAAEIAE